ncbi:type III-A CRISPR-associated RAMP protein Csm3 [Clostridium sp. Cult1]|uniref:type III-A CRISPR-associated RAMP protein Csm3 n=1 Tax=Clostridium sp. Cult1 TaxID=2079002 RepID=UPI001EFFF4D3|nr:type III-A CRISPR-associated RAMP protein Csm3 [Clostridium sp. Cult1]MCF6464270.1 type III-A CRISPR-associated RAMP protein Csm3 [Clostridium sp. Cult1]
MIKRYIIEYILECETGLQIQAGNISFDIGGIDNPVVKNPITDEPYIPGSSLKGKMRSLLEWQEAPEVLIQNEGQVLNDAKYDVCKLFGVSPGSIPKDKKNDNVQEKILVSRAIVRDAYLTEESKEMLQSQLGENIFTEIKAENSIDRLTSKATPRFFERVPKGAEFKGEIVLTQYVEEDKRLLDLLLEGMRLLQDNYLGGSGSRGAGKIKFKDVKIYVRDRDYYLGKKEQEIIEHII